MNLQSTSPPSGPPGPAWTQAWVQAQPIGLSGAVQAAWVGRASGGTPAVAPAGVGASHQLPLSGLRIIDLSRLLPGPMAARYLADLGAQVLKVEPPVAGQGDVPGDDAVHMGPKADGWSHFYRVVNHGKRRCALDLKQAGDLERLRELVGCAHAVVEGFRPGVMQRLGLDHDRLRELNPAIVLTSISGYGQEGPMRLAAGHDINYLALAGVLDQTRGTDGQPALCNLQIADLLGGAQTAAMGTLAGIIKGLLQGLGTHVDVSMTDAVRQHLVWAGVEQLQSSHERPEAGAGLLSGGVACYNVYRTLDARWMAVGALELKFWTTLCHALGQPAWADDHWSKGQIPGSPQARTQIKALAELFASRTQTEWCGQLAGTDACVTPVLDAAQALFNATGTADASAALARLVQPALRWSS